MTSHSPAPPSTWASSSSPRVRWVCLAVIAGAAALWTLGFFAVLLETPWRSVDDDENAAIVQAELLAAGLDPADARFQLDPSCGGCRVLTTVGWGLLSILPPLLVTWKLFPLAFGLFGVLAVAAAGWRLGGPRAGALAALLLALPPPLYRELGQKAWGNHFEVSGLIAAVIAIGASMSSSRQAFALGVAAALAVSFTYTAGPAVVALLGVAWLGGSSRRHLLGGLFVGGIPWLLLRLAGSEPWFAIYGRGSGRPWDPLSWLRVLGAPLAEGLWLPAGISGAPALLGWAGFVSVPAAMLFVAYRRRGPGEQAWLSLIGAFFAHVAAFVLVGSSLPVFAPTGGGEPGLWRYLAPLFPIVAIGASLLVVRVGRFAAVPALVLLLIGGLALVGDVSDSQFDQRPLHLPAPHAVAGSHAGRVMPDLAAPSPELRFDRPLARRQILFEQGLEATRRLIRGGPVHPNWWTWVHALPEVERNAVLLGAKTGLEEHLGEQAWGADQEPTEAFGALVRRHLPAELSRDCLRAHAWHKWGFASKKSDLDRAGGPGDWLAGYGTAVRELPADREANAEWSRGFGEGVGALRGYRPDGRSALEGLPAAHRAEAEAGFVRAQNWVFPLR